MFQVEALPAFEDNYIWMLRAADGRAAVFVDPGDAEVVRQAVRSSGARPVALLITHRHYDHTGGIQELAAEFSMPVYGPAREAISGLTRRVQEGDEIVLPELAARFTVLDVPGHTAGHVAYYGHGLLFCGDTLFTGGCGRLFEGTPEQMHASLSKFAALPDATLVYCAHEYTQDNLRFAQVVEPDNPALQARVRETARLRAAGRGPPQRACDAGPGKGHQPLFAGACACGA